MKYSRAIINFIDSFYKNKVILLRVKKSPEQNNANSNNNIVITNGKQTNQVNNIDNEQANENSNNQENNVNVLSNGILSVTSLNFPLIFSMIETFC